MELAVKFNLDDGDFEVVGEHEPPYFAPRNIHIDLWEPDDPGGTTLYDVVHIETNKKYSVIDFCKKFGVDRKYLERLIETKFQEEQSCL